MSETLNIKGTTVRIDGKGALTAPVRKIVERSGAKVHSAREVLAATKRGETLTGYRIEKPRDTIVVVLSALGDVDSTVDDAMTAALSQAGYAILPGFTPGERAVYIAA